MRLTAAQNATAAYVGKLKELYQHEMDYLNGLSKLSAPAEPVVDQGCLCRPGHLPERGEAGGR